MITLDAHNWSDYFECPCPKFVNSKIEMSSTDNLVVCEDGVVLQNSLITIVGSGNIVYLSRDAHAYFLNVRIYKNSVLYIDENNYFNGKLNMLIQEHQNVVVGKNNIFSYGISLMTSDAHLIYDGTSGKRINQSQSIYIGDHVWVGAYANILKGTTIGSGAIVGTAGVVTGKTCSSNSVWAGNPAKKVKSNVYWKKDCTNLFDLEMSEKFESDTDISAFMYEDDAKLDIAQIDDMLIHAKDLRAKMEILKKIRNTGDKNRFFCS